MQRFAATVAFLFASLALAGCADDAPAQDDVIDQDSFELETGKGAIAGILVDDRFRPIQLTDDPGTEFQTTGFVLLQETGEQVQTTENGEFAFVDLDPGTYTLRVTAGGHEATPQRVKVAEGVFNEATVVARRVASEGTTIITEEYSAFVPCNVNAPPAAVNCGIATPPDLSDDTDRSSFTVNHTEFGDQLTHWVTEMKTNKEATREGAVKLIIRSGDYFVNDAITEGDYLWTLMTYGEASANDLELRNGVFENDRDYTIQVWAQGILKDETQPLTAPLCTVDGVCAGETADSRGIGLQVGLRANLLMSLFIGEPDVDVMTYCALC